MRYTEQDHDRALSRLMDDINRTPKPAQPTAGLAVCIGLLMGILAIGALFALSGCNTLAGVGADLEAAAKGTQAYLAEDGTDEK